MSGRNDVARSISPPKKALLASLFSAPSTILAHADISSALSLLTRHAVIRRFWLIRCASHPRGDPSPPWILVLCVAFTCSSSFFSFRRGRGTKPRLAIARPYYRGGPLAD